MSVRVQRVVMPDGDEESWTVLDAEFRTVEPVEDFLAHLGDQERSPNTVKAYAHDLRDYFEYLQLRGLDWERVRFEDVAAFKPWLRMPVAARRGELSVLPTVRPHCGEATINRKLSGVLSFYEFHQRRGVEVAANLASARRLAAGTRSTWQPFLAHVSPRRPYRDGLKLRMPETRVQVLTGEQVQALLEACDRMRDRFLLALLYDSGLRVGEALGLRHEDVHTGDLDIEVRARRNANGARAKTWGRTVPVSAPLLRLHADYLFEEYGGVDSDYVFVSLWSSQPGRAWTYAAVHDLVGRLRRRTGIFFTPHMFRHTYATRLLQQGVAAEVVQRLLGHASAATTVDTYGHLTKADLRRALQAVGRLDDVARPPLVAAISEVVLWP